MSRKSLKKNRKVYNRECKLLSKRDIGKFERLCNSVDWCDEDSVFEFGVELGRWSVRLRALVLERSLEGDD